MSMALRKPLALTTLVSLIDPSPAPARENPRDAESWITQAQGSWLVGLDNLSTVPDWLSDAMCRAVTGDGDVRRRLYTDGELVVFSFRRVLAVTSIDLGALRGDLADRMLPVSLHTIDTKARKRESEGKADWQREHPRALGALLDLAADVFAALPSIKLAELPRMADFAEVLGRRRSGAGHAGTAALHREPSQHGCGQSFGRSAHTSHHRTRRHRLDCGRDLSAVDPATTENHHHLEKQQLQRRTSTTKNNYYYYYNNNLNSSYDYYYYYYYYYYYFSATCPPITRMEKRAVALAAASGASGTGNRGADRARRGRSWRDQRRIHLSSGCGVVDRHRVNGGARK